MAVVESIAEVKQTPSAQKGVLDYCMKPSKTFDEDEQLAYISGHNCIPEMANESFLATQKLFGHEPDGIRFYHFVQSFKIGEAISAQEANEIGMELAKQFGNHEAIVATHTDCHHLHNHIVVCAYDLESGKKLHYNNNFLADLRNLSDRICLEHGLEVLPRYDPSVRSKRMSPKEYRAAMRGNSWKMAVRVTIDFCMSRTGTREEFIAELRKKNCEVIWTPTRKNITFVYHTEDGKEHKVRDDNLNDDKYLKENIENEFRIRAKLYGSVEGDEYAESDTGRASGADTGAAGGSDSDGSDQRRGMEQPVRDGAENAGAVAGSDGTESRDEGIRREVRRGDEESSHGTDRSNRESDTQDSEGSDRTGWERERESFESYRQKNTSGRASVVATPRAHGNSNALGLTLMGARGLGNVASLLENGEESEEEKRQREAQNAGAAVGVVLGAGAVVVAGLTRKNVASDEDIDNKDIGDDENMDNEENQGFEISM